MCASGIKSGGKQELGALSVDRGGGSHGSDQRVDRRRGLSTQLPS